ncbi:flagellar hook-associated protein FlgK [Phreatobacter cathodiphilus]|uniref:Flagellar hook-associated protein 1 n=1 Tax=Phreatobacter cathodiphilus TaxID=1868589 RepID=A0A2S0NC26_9HYPH|nr:flagellar hook-associated protein FlgK [Phreatobacter cathodiphilus]AVO45481.1 flagellar hook-associated protein FlgK [Phreatobacter cathodiphilus]
MTLTSALSNSLSGLRFTSTATALTSANIANAGNPSYTRKLIDPVDALAGDQIAGVAVGSIRREYDAFVQRQLVGERSNAAYASTRSQFLSRLDQMMGAPGSARALDTVLNTFSSSFQTLLTSPESDTARSGVINSATVVAQTLRSLSSATQDMRLDAESGLADATVRLNTLLTDLSKINARLSVAFTDESRVGLLDQRDAMVSEIADYVQVRTVYDDSGAVQLYGGAGFVLLSTSRSELSFDSRDIIGPTNVYDEDPTKRTVGTITATTPSGTVDLIAAGVFTSGKIAALIELRDKALPATQAQLDQIAANLAQALGNTSTSTPVTVAGPGPTTGFDTALGSGLVDGDTVTMELTANGVTQKITFKRVDDGAVTMSDDMTADPNDIVFRLTGTSAAGHAAQMQAAIDTWAAGAGAPAGAFSVSVSGGNLRVLADPTVTGGASVGSAAANVTARTLTDGGSALPFFVDTAAANGLYSGQVTGSGAQYVGLASRIDVNGALKADPSALVKINSSTLESDETRPSFLVAALASTDRYFAPAGSLGTTSNPFQGSVLSYARSVIVTQTNDAASALQVAEGQEAVVTQLQARFDSVAAVNIDDEMTLLIQLQTAYGANARVMSAVREMLDVLQRM